MVPNVLLPSLHTVPALPGTTSTSCFLLIGVSLTPPHSGCAITAPFNTTRVPVTRQASPGQKTARQTQHTA